MTREKFSRLFSLFIPSKINKRLARERYWSWIIDFRHRSLTRSRFESRERELARIVCLPFRGRKNQSFRSRRSRTDRSHRTSFSRRNVPFIAVPVRAKKRLGRTSRTQLRAIITRSFTTPRPAPLLSRPRRALCKEQNGSSVFYKKKATRNNVVVGSCEESRCCRLRGAVSPVRSRLAWCETKFFKRQRHATINVHREAFSFLCVCSAGREAVHAPNVRRRLLSAIGLSQSEVSSCNRRSAVSLRYARRADNPAPTIHRNRTERAHLDEARLSSTVPSASFSLYFSPFSQSRQDRQE